MKLLIIDGPNINLQGQREKNIYGNISFNEMNEIIQKKCCQCNIILQKFQFNSEGEIINKLHYAKINKFDWIIINAGAYSHYSIAIRDAISSIKIKTIEVHISNIYSREYFRRKSILSNVCTGTINGFGIYSYLLAIDAILYYQNEYK